jgi:hypothetical protein
MLVKGSGELPFSSSGLASALSTDLRKPVLGHQDEVKFDEKDGLIRPALCRSPQSLNYMHQCVPCKPCMLPKRDEPMSRSQVQSLMHQATSQPYGLGGCSFTRSKTRVNTVISSLEAGGAHKLASPNFGSFCSVF